MRRVIGVGVLVLAMVLAALWRVRQPDLVRIDIVPFTEVNASVVEGFRAALAERGFVEGKTVEYKIMPADGRIDAPEPSWLN